MRKLKKCLISILTILQVEKMGNVQKMGFYQSGERIQKDDNVTKKSHIDN